MGVKTSGSLSLTSDIVGEFGGSAPHSLSEYKRGGSYVPNISHNNDIPTSNSDIRFSDYYGTTSYVPSAQGFTSNGTYALDASVTSIQYYISGGGAGGQRNVCLNCHLWGSAGGATTLTFNTGQTITAGGGGGGARGGNHNNNNHFNNSGWPDPPWNDTTHSFFNDGRSDGGHGAHGNSNCTQGSPGYAGSGYTGTYNTPSGATSIEVTIGGGGGNGGGGDGGYSAHNGWSGAAWILGVQ
jgi:hypothetical protein